MSTEENRILWASIEDYTGLWELVWGLSADYPHMSEAGRRAVAERIVRDLLARGCIELYERQHQVSGNEELVPKERRDDLLRDQANWREPSSESVELLVAATDFGERLYAEGTR